MLAAMAAVFVLAAAGFATTAQYVARAPGENLQPQGNAELVVSILQGRQHILWTSLTGSVASVTVRGWPVRDGEVELGGALAITRPDSGEAGIIDFGEKPMSVIFGVNP
jgi:uncharacterized protein YcsI (UPF0317 family)